MTVGLIGVGRIGLPVCARLIDAGHAVLATDLLPERVAAARGLGAETLADAATVDVLITVLPGPDEVRDAMVAAGPALRAGAAWIDLTSASPAVGAALREPLLARGVECLDAPVGGGIAAAREGALQLFVGGPAATVERHRSLLEALGTIEHMGDHGAGQLTKLLVNLLWFAQAVVTAEALLLARSAGIELGLLHDVLGRSAAASTFIERDLDALLAGDYLESFELDRCCEELDAVIALAAERGLTSELSRLVARTYRDALERYGPVPGELLAVALLEQRAGLSLRATGPPRSGRHEAGPPA